MADSSVSGSLTATGFYTQEVRVQGERVGFDVTTLDGLRGPLARSGTARRGTPAVGKYVVDVPSFEALALPSLRPAPSTKLVVIDEVGKMELFSAAFYPAVQAVLDDAHLLVLGSVPVPRYGRSIPQVEALKARPDVQVISVSKENRDQLVSVIAQEIHQSLRHHPALSLSS
jgi:nucleoside-triphosphatase